MSDTRPILVATDGSAEAREAVRLGIETARERGAEVRFVWIVSPSHPRARSVERGPLAGFAHHELTPSFRDVPLQEAAASAAAAGVSYRVRLRVGSNPVRELADIARKADAASVVVGRSRRRRRRSFAARLQRRVESPVVVAGEAGAPTAPPDGGR